MLEWHDKKVTKDVCVCVCVIVWLCVSMYQRIKCECVSVYTNEFNVCVCMYVCVYVCVCVWLCV